MRCSTKTQLNITFPHHTDESTPTLPVDQSSDCPERKLCCASCGDTLPARQLDEHTSTLCRRTTWTCGCGRGPFPIIDRSGHLKSCEAFIDAWEAAIEKVGAWNRTLLSL